MDSSFIPPPFPFPELWPKVFAEQEQCQERKWLTPTTFIPLQWQTMATSEYNHVLDQASPLVVTKCSSDAQQDMNGDDEESEDDAYEYGYVLTNEWREHFQSSILLSQQAKSKTMKKMKKKKKLKNKKTSQSSNAGAVAAFSASRSGHLQREIQAAKTRELARQRKRRDNIDASRTSPANPEIIALETSLNLLFDDFCDAFQPVLWPHE
ncbi:unnamed protein product [Peronospora belbahrii]|uniref:BZIP domain-containing protein n=1 Tax=Peronospora belbahrii TaxID=622444 RepID=A0AAU9KL06_9STRA|nr:unnamed protein product [Peronospora belbahrii]